MNAAQKIPPYYPSQKKRNQNMVAKELHRQEKRLQAIQKKNRKLKAQCANQKLRRKQAEQQLKQEQIDAVEREKHIRLQTKLDDFAFYCENIWKE